MRRGTKRMLSWILVIFFATLIILSCGFLKPKPSPWGDSIHFQGITYTHPQRDVGRAITQSDLGSQYATIRFQINGHVSNVSAYQMRDGDATELSVGTPIYAMREYQTTFRLIARVSQGNFELYQALVNSNARVGSDLLDIQNKVASIDITNLTPLGDLAAPVAVITRATDIETLVNEILTAPASMSARSTPTPGGHSPTSVVSTPKPTTPTPIYTAATPLPTNVIGSPPPTNNVGYLIVFHLRDGTAVVCDYTPSLHFMTPGIIVPLTFVDSIKQFVAQHEGVDQ
jgi:hypothetical protein